VYINPGWKKNLGAKGISALKPILKPTAMPLEILYPIMILHIKF